MGDTFLGDGRLERIEVHDDEVDGLNAVIGGLLAMLGEVAAVEEAAMDFRMQGLDPAIEHFREAGEVRNLNHRNAEGGDEFRGAAGGKDLHPVSVETFGKLVESGLVGDRDEGAGDAHRWRSMIRPTGSCKVKSGRTTRCGEWEI